MKKAKRHTSPLLVVLILLLFAAGFGAGWLSASVYRGPAEQASVPSAEPTLPDDVPSTPPSDEPTRTPPDRNSWNLVLVNFETPLPDGFAVPTLAKVREGQYVDSRAYDALKQMLDAARAEGLEPLVCSSYRDWDTQVRLFEAEVQDWLDKGYAWEEAEAQAAVWVARPGTSEHQTGLTVDIVDISYQLLNEEQEKTPVQQWLMAHCAEYGFILRYPLGKGDITGISYEPWHYRYVGVEAAQEITERGLCLEEYLLG